MAHQITLSDDDFAALSRGVVGGVSSVKNRLPPSHDEGVDQETILIARIHSHQRLNQVSTVVDKDVFARLLFQFGDFVHHIS